MWHLIISIFGINCYDKKKKKYARENIFKPIKEPYKRSKP